MHKTPPSVLKQEPLAYVKFDEERLRIRSDQLTCCDA